MAECIEREAYVDLFKGEHNLYSWEEIEEFMDSIPAADVVPVPEGGIGELSDGYHTFNGLYYQRMVLFAALVKQNKDKAWKSLRHEDGELCFGGGWFIVGIDTPSGSYTYHYEDNFWSMFDCQELPVAKNWDGHTEKDVTRLLSLADVQPVVRCKDCVHRPYYEPSDSKSVSDLVFPDYRFNPCPCRVNDVWYSWMPDDDWFCAYGKRKDDET